MRKLLLLGFFLCFFAMNAQSKLTPYQKRIQDLSLNFFKKIGISEAKIAQLRNQNMSDLEAFMRAGDLVNKVNTEKGFFALMEYERLVKDAEKLKNSVDFARDKAQMLEKQKAEEVKQKKREVAQKKEEFERSDYFNIRKEVSEKLAEWIKKGEFEKVENWKDRIDNESERAFKKFCNEAILSGKTYNLNLGKYDSEKEMFPFTLATGYSNHSIDGTVRVPIEFAENFKNGVDRTFSFTYNITYRFVDNNLYPTEFTHSVFDRKYNFITDAMNLPDNTDVSFSELQFENKPAINSIFNINMENKAKSQGNSASGIGNEADPLGGDENGDSRIGIDRRLVGFIPGTMGRERVQPSHNCSGRGQIIIAYTVDKAGNVTSARRSGGISDTCVISTSVEWVKKYVKAEKASGNSIGIYKITF